MSQVSETRIQYKERMIKRNRARRKWRWVTYWKAVQGDTGRVLVYFGFGFLPVGYTQFDNAKLVFYLYIHCSLCSTLPVSVVFWL